MGSNNNHCFKEDPLVLVLNVLKRWPVEHAVYNVSVRQLASRKTLIYVPVDGS